MARSAVRWTLLLGLIALCAAAVVGCGGSDDSSDSASTGGDGSAASANGNSGSDEDLIILVSGPAGNAFFAAMKQGADAAAKELGVNYQYTGPKDLDNFVPDYTAILQQAIARKPAALAIGNFAPEAFDPYIKKATDAGIPVVVLNAGIPSLEKVGALGYVGEEPLAGGEAGGAKMAEAGVTNLLCVNGAPVNPDVNERCKGAMQGVEKAGGKATELKIPLADSGNPPVVERILSGYLASHPDIDGIYTTGAAMVPPALKVIEKTGRDIKLGTADLSTFALEKVKSGDMVVAVDQQPWLQGYEAIKITDQFLKYGMFPTAPVITGGLAIDEENVDRVLEVQEEYDGVRGAL